MTEELVSCRTRQMSNNSLEIPCSVITPEISKNIELSLTDSKNNHYGLTTTVVYIRSCLSVLHFLRCTELGKETEPLITIYIDNYGRTYYNV